MGSVEWTIKEVGDPPSCLLLPLQLPYNSGPRVFFERAASLQKAWVLGEFGTVGVILAVLEVGSRVSRTLRITR